MAFAWWALALPGALPVALLPAGAVAQAAERAGAARASTPAVQRLRGNAAAARMRSLLAGKPTIEGRFEQAVYDTRGALVQRSLGTFTAQQPRQLHWQVQSPAAQLLVTDGKQIWLYDPDLQQVTIDTLDAVTAEAPMLVLSGQVESLLTKFDLTAEGSGRDWTFDLRVRAGAAAPGTGFQSISVRVERGDVVGMRVQDAMRQRTELTFSGVTHPARVDAKLFRFVVPPGTEVVQR